MNMFGLLAGSAPMGNLQNLDSSTDDLLTNCIAHCIEVGRRGIWKDLYHNSNLLAGDQDNAKYRISGITRAKLHKALNAQYLTNSLPLGLIFRRLLVLRAIVPRYLTSQRHA
jgi:hypothetical protein